MIDNLFNKLTLFTSNHKRIINFKYSWASPIQFVNTCKLVHSLLLSTHEQIKMDNL